MKKCFLMATLAAAICLTGQYSFAQAPNLQSYSPGQNALDVDAGAIITVTFDSPIDQSTVNSATFVVFSRNVLVAGLLLYHDATSFGFAPTDDFAPGSIVTVILTSGIQSPGGEAFAGFSWSFTIEVLDGTGVFNNYEQFYYDADNGDPGSYCVCAADFNQDGWDDVAAAMPRDSLTVIFINDQQGGFVLPRQRTPKISTGSNLQLTPIFVAAADFNKDGYPDLATTGYGYYGHYLHVFINTGVPGDLFGYSDPYYEMGVYGNGSYAGAQQMTIADFNLDGNLDIALARDYTQWGQNTMSIFLNDGTGHFSIDFEGYLQGYLAICSADFDNDGDIDMAGAKGINSFRDLYIYVNMGQTPLSFTEYALTNLGEDIGEIYPADINGDGWLDLPYTQHIAAPLNSKFSILFNDRLADPITYSDQSDTSYILAGQWYAGPADILAQDFMHDGDLDVIIGNAGSPDNFHYIEVLRNDDSCFYTESGWWDDPRYQRYNCHDRGEEICSGDFNHDFTLDIAVISDSGIVMVTNRQQPCPYIPGDVNSNDAPNGIDVTYAVGFLKGGPVPPDACFCPPLPYPFYAAGDVNGTCSFNGVDISYFVNYLKGGPALQYCPTCPPFLPLNSPDSFEPPAVIKSPVIVPAKEIGRERQHSD